MSACYCDFEAPEFYSTTRPTARKEHRCSECRGHVRVGEQYERAFGKWDGRIDTFITCARCLALREWITAHAPCFCLSHGNLREEAIETARHYADEAPGLLFGTWRREIAIRRHERPILPRKPLEGALHARA